MDPVGSGWEMGSGREEGIVMGGGTGWGTVFGLGCGMGLWEGRVGISGHRGGGGET